jgi:hypothetical protein
LFPKQRYILALEIRTNAENAQIFEKDLQEFNSIMTASAICQEIGIQALFAAATMGAASYLATTARMVSWGEGLAALGEEGGIVRSTVGVVARVGGYSSSAARAAALTGVLSRAASGILILALRRVTGDLGTKKPMDSQGLGSAIFVTLAFAWLGSPGAPKATSWPLKLLIEKLPSAVSMQSLAQAGLVVNAGLKAWINAPENRPFIQHINANRETFNRQLEQVGAKSAQQVLDWGMRAQHEIAREVGDAARKIDYAQKLPFFARNFDFVGNAEALRDMSVNAAIYEAQTSFWIQMVDCFSELESAVRAAQQIGK